MDQRRNKIKHENILNKNGSTTYQNLQDTIKSRSKQEVYSYKCLYNKSKTSNKQLNLIPQNLQKEKQSPKLAEGRRQQRSKQKILETRKIE